MKSRVLIVEDVAEMAQLVALYLAKDGFECRIAGSAEEGQVFSEKETFDLVILDLSLPAMDGFEFLRLLRKRSPVPVLILSARDDDQDVVLGLGLGADEFLFKTASPRTLAARCQALLRRSQGTVAPRRLRFAEFELDLDTRLLFRGSEPMKLSPKEFELLKFFLENPRQAFRPEEIFAKVWGAEFGELSTVGVYVQRLRKKIEKAPSEPALLQTVRGFGYSFQA